MEYIIIESHCLGYKIIFLLKREFLHFLDWFIYSHIKFIQIIVFLQCYLQKLHHNLTYYFQISFEDCHI